MSQSTKQYSAEVRERAVRLVLEHQGEYRSRWKATESIASKIGCSAYTLHEWIKRAQDRGGRTAQEAGAREPGTKAGQRDFAQGQCLFCPGGARPPTQVMIAFIDEHREAYGVEPICRVLPIAPSTYHDHGAKGQDPLRESARAKRDKLLKIEIQRLMRALGLQGVVRGRKVHTTTRQKDEEPCPLDRVQRQFQAVRPNVLWVSDFTYVATWAGFVYVALVIDVFARRIVGWRVSQSPRAALVLDALEQALQARRPKRGSGLIHHSDRGVQYLSIKYTLRLVEAGIEASVGSVGDSYDNALAETLHRPLQGRAH
jgi:putative transposase